MSRPYVPRVNAGGNFCGHNPAKPRLVTARPAADRQPLILRRLKERLLPDFYARPGATLPTLNAANNSPRTLRSEARESCLLVLAAILNFTDVASLRCGLPTDEGFAGLTIKTLATHAGVTLRRAERAVAYLKRAGLLTVASLAQKQADGTFVGIAAVKAVNKHLWGAFGLLEMLVHERDKASARVKKQAKRFASATGRATSRAALALSGLHNLVKRPRNTRTQSDPERRRRQTLREIELRTQHPDWPLDAIRRQASQDLA